ncbi:helix-turn-helix domain-containing protein [Siphonobacter sp.]|uniref:helix-turn-helix domain-containing protein n=1 Tax=Siphonobacter sp. TaxID=1869184 RepID=UPI003B3AF6D1
MVPQKIQQQGMSEKKLAELLGMGAAKVSHTLSGKREPDVTFLKGVHQKLSIDDHLILDFV